MALQISSNSRARMSVIVSLPYSAVTGAPDFAGEIADANTAIAALDASVDAQVAALEAEITALEGANNFTQVGTGAVAYPVLTKIAQIFSVKDFGAVGDGTTNDAVNINKAIVALIAAGGGELYFPRGTYNCNGTTLIADLSAISTLFQGRIIFRGDGVASIIQNTTSSTACFKYLGRTGNTESYFEFRNIRLKGNNAAPVTGSKGLEINLCAFAQVRGVAAEGFEYGHYCTDVEQLEFSNNEWRWNKNGGIFNGAVSSTDANNILITNNQYSNNSLTGLTVIHANAFKITGGIIAYNGLVGGPSNTGGLFLTEAGTGYGTVSLDTVALEGNGGAGDVVSTQTTNPAIIAFESCSFLRTDVFGPTVGYGTNNINAAGSNANTVYVLSGNTFLYFGTYAQNAARPTIALNNTSCKIFDDGTNYFKSATEKLTYPVGQIVLPVLGNATVRGTLGVTGLISANSGMAGGSAANSILALASTSSGAPSGDAVNITATAINLNAVNIAALTTAWTAYTPTFTPSAGALTTTTPVFAFKLVGKTVHWRGKVTITNAGTGSGTLNVTLPAGHTLAGDFTPSTVESVSLGITYYGRGAAGGTSIDIATAAGAGWVATGKGVSMSGTYEIT